MRREIATLLSAAISVVPAGIVAMFGDGRAQYGFSLLLIAWPFYCVFVAALVVLVSKTTTALGFPYLSAYLGAALLTSLLLTILLLHSDGGWVSTLAGVVGLMTAFLLVPVLESKASH